MRRLSLAVCVLTASVCVVSATAGGTPEFAKLPPRSAKNDVNPRDLKPPPLKAGVAYAASQFPITIRLTSPDARWTGGQGQSLEHKSRTPLFGWVELVPAPSTRPLGAISIVSAYGGTGSVAATVSRLRAGGTGASYEATAPVTVAGFSGVQFGGKVAGQGHAFIPFSKREHVARFYPDMYFLDAGEAFRIDVLTARGKTVVILIESASLPAAQFSTFLDAADRLLQSLRFPGS